MRDKTFRYFTVFCFLVGIAYSFQIANSLAIWLNFYRRHVDVRLFFLGMSLRRPASFFVVFSLNTFRIVAVVVLFVSLIRKLSKLALSAGIMFSLNFTYFLISYVLSAFRIRFYFSIQTLFYFSSLLTLCVVSFMAYSILKKGFETEVTPFVAYPVGQMYPTQAFQGGQAGPQQPSQAWGQPPMGGRGYPQPVGYPMGQMHLNQAFQAGPQQPMQAFAHPNGYGGGYPQPMRYNAAQYGGDGYLANPPDYNQVMNAPQAMAPQGPGQYPSGNSGYQK